MRSARKLLMAPQSGKRSVASGNTRRAGDICSVSVELQGNSRQEQEFLPAMKMKGLAACLLMLSLASAGISAACALPGPPPPQNPYGPPPPLRPGWDAPPGRFRTDIERRAFQEGIRGARRDRENGRRPDVNNRDEYMRRTAFPVPSHMLRAYRRAFRAGYEHGVEIFYGPPRRR